jgi:hypothetical protein
MNERPVPDDPEDGTSPQPVRRGPMLRALLVVFCGVLFGFAAVDQYIVSWDSDQGADGGDSGILRHEQLGWVARPHFENPKLETRLDRFGLRNPEIPDDAPATEVRIAGFGASRTYGAGGALQPWCWNYQLQEWLAPLLEPDARVLNGGVMAYSGLQACRRAAALLEALEPDLVFVVISPGAQLLLDPSAARNWVRFGERAEQLVPADVVAAWPDALVPLVARIHQGLNAVSGIYRRHRAKFQANDKRDEGLQRWMISRAPRSATVEAMLEATLDEAQALAARCAERGVELRIVVLPEISQDAERAWNEFLVRNQPLGAPPLGTPRAEPTDVLAELLEARGVRTWNFFDEVDRMGTDRARYIMDDNFHWSFDGHAVFGRGLLSRLRGEGLLEELAARRAAHPRARPYGANPFAQSRD